MITISPYQPVWPERFRQFGQVLRAELGELALRIDHIGSTSVPGLAAKDRIDIQVTVTRLEEPVARAIQRAGYYRHERITCDHIPPGATTDPPEWGKWLFNPQADPQAANLHVRVLGRANQRYPILFRDYLRAQPATAAAYAQVKSALARLHPDDVDAYYDVKDPVCDIIIGGAELWAAATNWAPGASDC